MLIKGIHHVQLTIPTGMEEEAITFYCGVLAYHKSKSQIH